jgi:DNA-binding NtrC family response regulator
MCRPDDACIVLLIEDEISLRTLFLSQRAALMKDGLDMRVVATLREGIDVLAKEDVQIVLLDLNLQNTRGIDTLDIIAPLVKDKRAILFVYTADGNQIVDLMHAHGADELFIKGDMPVIHLLKIVHYAAGQVRANNRLRKERDTWKERAESAQLKAAEVEDRYNRLIDKHLNLPAGSEKFEKFEELGRSIIEMKESAKSLSVAH